MNKLISIARSIHPATILRIGIAGVVIWFGFSQILDQTMWQSFIPDWAISLSGLSAITLVKINGIFEVIAGTLLVYGVWVRILAGLLFVHMLGIVSILGTSPTGMRDVGIAVALLSVAWYGSEYERS